jgi:hypothetical protein
MHKIFNADSEIRLAREIVLSWAKPRSNIIVMAPPMTRPRSLFGLISDPVFVESLLGIKARSMSIAKLDTSDFKSEVSFVAGVLRGWHVAGHSSLEHKGPIEQLEIGVQIVRKNGLSPVLLIQRFHEALSKLGEDVGTSLRNLEHDFGLRTVVELPISLHVLRERWELSKTSHPPFLASDWGQGHLTKLLKGYSRDEITNRLTAEKVVDVATTDFIYAATSGLPELVDSLISDAPGRSLTAIKAIFRSRASQACARTLEWLDKPGENTYKNVFVSALTDSTTQDKPVSLNDHDWRELLCGDAGKVRPLMLAWASVDALATIDDRHFRGAVDRLFQGRDFDGLEALLSGCECASDAQKLRWRALGLVADFGRYSDPFTPNWTKLEGSIRDIQSFIAEFPTAEVARHLSALMEWRNLVSFMLSFEALERASPEIRLEEFVSHNKKADAQALIAFVQLLRLRLESARQMSDYHFVKAIIEQPESVLQVYSNFKYGYSFWSHSGDLQEAAKGIEVFIKRAFHVPKQGAKLGFVELLYLCFQGSVQEGSPSALIPNVSAIAQLEELYELRKQQVHSTAFVAPSEALSYHQWCMDWLDGLSKLLGPAGASLQLVMPMTIAAKLLEI